MINIINTSELSDKFLSSLPFNHIVIDNFFEDNIANDIATSFPSHSDDVWTVSYNNPVENKKACSHWDKFPPSIYSAMFYLCSANFISILKHLTKNDYLYADYGLHGGGMHSHNRGGKLNIHKDYSVHPKLNLERNYNLIVYMTPNWNPDWGGGLELWSHDSETNEPKECVVEIENKFNRAIIFDTTQNSWHGLPQELTCPKNIARRSLASYYVTDLHKNSENIKRAHFVPYGEQKNNPEIVEFCKKRSGL
jgi:Rps23 Pro-64 3,4-dihydroxylase Tpa1-like proline 4-hydroxylase